MGTVIVVVSGKGGTGKTTTVGAVASCLASRGHRTLCIDCDVGLKNLDLNLGLTGISLVDFTDVLDGKIELGEAVTAHPEIENLFFLSAPTNISPEDIDTGKMAELAAKAREDYEFTFVDAPAGIGPGFRLAVTGADMAVVVATGDAPGLRDAQRTVAELRSRGIENVRLVINRLKPRFYKELKNTIDDVIDMVGARLIGVVSEEEDVMLAGSREIPLVLCDSNPAMRQLNRISFRIEGFDVPLGKIK